MDSPVVRQDRKTRYRRFRVFTVVLGALVIATGLQLQRRYGWTAYFATVIPGLFIVHWVGAVLFKQRTKPWRFRTHPEDRDFD